MKLILGTLILGVVVAGLIWRVKHGGHCGCGPVANTGKKP